MSTIYYRADFDDIPAQKESWTKWKPSIHMFRKDSRILLEITDIRVERVQDISRVNACAEGVANNYPGIDTILTFHKLWDTINAKRGYGWEVNPWVWVIEFKILKDLL